MSTEPCWSDDQVAAFAKQIRKDLHQAWDFMVPTVREGMVDSFIMRIIFSQKGEVAVHDVRVLRERLTEKLGL